MKSQYQIKDFIPDPNTNKDRWEVYDIKQGGMGWVYIVYDHQWRESFAVKTYKDERLQTEKAREDFKKEALIWINLDRHENITRARFIQEIKGRIFLFLEYVAGGDLSQYIGTKSLDIKQIITYALMFCYGMEYATTHGIACHRDIKPKNCLITTDKILKITDFGFAKASDTYIEKLYGEIGIGTLLYMSPEQFEVKEHLDIRSDIYSVGVMLYEMISGKLPFYGSTFNELKEKHQKKEIPDIAANLNKEEKPLLDIVYTCLNKNPVDRYSNFTELKNKFNELYTMVYKKQPLPAQTGIKLRAGDLNNKGTSFVALNLNKEAIECFDAAIKMIPEYTDAWYNKGVSYENLYQYHEADNCYSKALEINPEYHQAWCNKGVVLGKLNNKQEEIECYNKTITINPDYIDAWYNKGIALGEIQQFKNAIECFDTVIDLDPKFYKAWFAKGLALRYLNRYEEAVACYNNALELNNKDAEIFYNKGVILEKLNRQHEAIESYSNAVKLDHNHSKAWCNEGIVFFNLKKYEEAIKCINKAINIDPDDFFAWFYRGVTFGFQKNLTKALECLHRAKELGHPDAAQAIMYFQKLLQQQEES